MHLSKFAHINDGTEVMIYSIGRPYHLKLPVLAHSTTEKGLKFKEDIYFMFTGRKKNYSRRWL